MSVLAGSWVGIGGSPGLLSHVDTQDRQDDLPFKIDRYGHYAWFPLGPDSWGRGAEPYDTQEGESRWLAQPTNDGGVRVRVENLGTEPPHRNAGFDLHLGPVGELETVTVEARTLRTANTTGPATLFVGLYLDSDDDQEFFGWDPVDGMERFTGLGDDEGGSRSSARAER